jgi:hypothetical protein
MSIALPCRAVVRARAPLALGLALAAVYGLPNLIYPLFEDAGLFALIGHWMNHGLHLYSDLVDQKPPFAYLLMQLGTGLFGTSSLGLRIFESLAILLCAWSTGKVAASSGVARSAEWTTVVTGLGFSSLLWGLPERGQLEVYQATVGAAGMALFVNELGRLRPARLALAGGVLTLAAWIKPQGLFLPLFATVAVLVMELRARDVRRAVRRALLLGLGGLFVSLALLGWLLLTGSWQAFLDVMFRWNAEYLSQTSSPKLWQTVAALPPSGMGLGGWLLILGLAAHGGFVAARQSAVLALCALSWLAAGFAQFWLGRYLFNYHKLVLVPPAALLLGIGLADLWARAGALGRAHSRWAWLRPLCALLLALCPLLSASYRADWRSLLSVVAGARRLDLVYAQHGREMHYFDWQAQRSAARYITDHTGPEDTVQVLGRASVFYLEVHRRPASRFLVTGGALDLRRKSHDEANALLRADITRARPAYVLVRSRDVFPWFGLRSSIDMLEADGEFRAWLLSRYDMVGVLGNDFLVLKRHDYGVTESRRPV